MPLCGLELFFVEIDREVGIQWKWRGRDSYSGWCERGSSKCAAVACSVLIAKPSPGMRLTIARVYNVKSERMREEKCREAIQAVNTLIQQGSVYAAKEQVVNLANQMKTEVFVSYSPEYNFPLFADILKQTLPWIESEYDQFRNFVSRLINQWLVFAATYSPVEFLQTLKTLSSHEPQYLYFTLQSFLDALDQVTEEEQPKFIVLMIKIVDSSPIQDLARSVTPHVWDMFQSNTSEMNVLRLIKRFVEGDCGELAVSVLVRKNPRKFTEYLFQKASLRFISIFLRLLPKDFDMDVLSISVRIADAFHEDNWNYETLYDLVPIIAQSPTTIEKAGLRPIWESLEEFLQKEKNGAILKALYAAVSIGAYNREDIIQYLDYDFKNASYQFESFRIAIDLADLETFRPNLLRILPQVSATRKNKLALCLLDRLDVLFKLLYPDDPRGSLSIVSTALNPLPADEMSRNLVLKFLNSVSDELLKEYPFVFNYVSLIESCLASGCISHLERLSELIKKVGYHIDPLRLSWIGDPLCLSVEICENPPLGVLKELLEFRIVPFTSIPKVVSRLKEGKDASFYSTAHDTLFWLTYNTGGNNVKVLEEAGCELVVDKSFVTNQEMKELIRSVSSPYHSCNLGRIVGSLLEYLDVVYDEVEHSPAQNMSLAVMARFLSRIFPSPAISLISKLLARNEMTESFKNTMTKDLLKDYVPERQTPHFARFAVAQFGAERAYELYPTLCVDASKLDRDLATTFAQFLKQPLPLMRTFLAFQHIEKHKDWVEHCRREIPRDQWILAEGDDGYVPPPQPKLPQENSEEEEVEFVFRRPKPALGISNVFDGTRYSLISYFTHYTSTTRPAEIPSVTIEDLEDFVYQHANEDIRLVIGFFFYAYKRKYKTSRIEDWTKKLTSIRTDAEMYAVSLFLNSISFSLKELPDFLADFLCHHLLFMGYCTLSKHSLNYAFRKETGLRWFFIRSIISLDPNFMGEFPLVLAEFADRQSLVTVYQQYMSRIDSSNQSDQLMSLFVSMVAVLFKPNKVIQYRRWPIAHRVLFGLPITPTLPVPVRVDSAIVESLITTLSQQQHFPTNYLTLFLNMNIERQFYDRVAKFVTPKSNSVVSLFRAYLPSLYFLPVIEIGEEPVLDEDALNFFENRAPSFSLAFHRSLMSFLSVPLRQSLISEIESLLCPVFPEFGYNGLKVWDTACDVTRIIRGEKFDSESVNEIHHVGRVSLAVYNALMSNSSFVERDFATATVLKLALSRSAAFSFAVGVADSISRYNTRIEDIVLSPGFVDNAENVLNAIFFVSRLAKVLGKPDLVENVKNNTREEEKAKLFEILESREKLKEALNRIV